jgi:TATA-box binding protein (TBP) (component of TFIID and TFIIIB)
MNIEIVNVVAVTFLNHMLDLKAVSSLVPNNAYFKLENYGIKFKRIVWKFKKATIVISESRILCLGAKAVNQAKAIMQKVFNVLKLHGFIITTPFNFKVLNIVAKVDFDKGINLEDLAVKLEKCIYEPEQHAALIYRDETAKATFLIFSNGKVIVVGLKSEQHAAKAIENLASTIETNEMMPVSIYE